jgi:hypothetical protein
VDPKVPDACERGLRIVPQIGDRFVPKPVMAESGVCLERAVIEVRGAGGARKGHARYTTESVVTFGPEVATIREQLALSSGPSEGASAARDSFVRRVQADRQLRLRAGTLVATAPSLLTRWRADVGGRDP